MYSNINLVLMIIISVTKTFGFESKCRALKQTQLKKSCFVCQKYFRYHDLHFPGFQIQAACLTLAQNDCCEYFRLAKKLIVNKKVQFLRHLNHGIDLI